MFVINRQGKKLKPRYDAITDRLTILAERDPPILNVDPAIITKEVVGGIEDGISTEELDIQTAIVAARMNTTHPDYSKLAGRIISSNIHKNTSDSFETVCNYLFNNKHNGEPAPLIAEDVMVFILKNINAIEEAINYHRDYTYDYFGIKTLERSYLLRTDGKIRERPQHMLMRVACGIHVGDIGLALESYKSMSNGMFTHASPTLFNAGTPNPQMSSCFLMALNDDSIKGIYKTVGQCAEISKHAGGIGVHIHNVRAEGSYIRGTGGYSNGLVPMLRVFDSTARYVDQGGGKRNGAFAIYLETWHADIFKFLCLKKNTGIAEVRARDLFYGLWNCDLFMIRVKENGIWSLMCPNECKGLSDVYGDEFNKLYESYEKRGMFREQCRARELWYEILKSQIETGTPYMLYKDSCNKKSNQKNLGTIKSSNLCTEIVEYSSPDEIAVCNLASISLKMFAKKSASGECIFDFDHLREITKQVTFNLNRVIDRNFYPLPEARNSNMRHRPIGIGVQGLADLFLKMRLPFTSDKAKELNRKIFEHIYFAACEESMNIAKVDGAYETFAGSPASKGILQFDMWNVKPSESLPWDKLKKDIVKYGLRNSLLTAPMPTASTSQILGNNECFEPFTSNIYVRRTSAGEFVVVSKYLVEDLLAVNLWDEDMKNLIIKNSGSIQDIDSIPDDIKELHKISWDIEQRHIIDMAADRGAFIDQSQSMNIHIANPNIGNLTSMHFYGWEKGLKTGMYYLRTKPTAKPQQYSIKPVSKSDTDDEDDGTSPAPKTEVEEVLACSIDNREACESCSG